MLSNVLKKPKKRTLADAERDIEHLKAQLIVSKQECEFWTEQARNLQNHLQVVMRGQASMLEQMARSSMTAADVQACVEQVSRELRQPLTQIEATKALVSSVREGTQGEYTAVKSSVREGTQGEYTAVKSSVREGTQGEYTAVNARDRKLLREQ